MIFNQRTILPQENSKGYRQKKQKSLYKSQFLQKSMIFIRMNISKRGYFLTRLYKNYNYQLLYLKYVTNMVLSLYLIFPIFARRTLVHLPVAYVPDKNDSISLQGIYPKRASLHSDALPKQMPDSLHTRSCAFHKDLSAAGILSYIRDDKILLTIKSELFFVAMGFILIAFMPVFCFLVTVHCSSSCVH